MPSMESNLSPKQGLGEEFYLQNIAFPLRIA